jgi:hypothetical protein
MTRQEAARDQPRDRDTELSPVHRVITVPFAIRR